MFQFWFKSDRNNMKKYIRIYKHLKRGSINIYYCEEDVPKKNCRE
jgi:hypothetical protein